MSRRWLGIALLLSLGVNLGVVAVLLGERAWPRGEPAVEDDPSTAPSTRPLDTPHRPDGSPPAGPPAWDGPEGPVDAMPPLILRRLHILADRLGLRAEDRERFLAIQRAFFQETRRHRVRIVALQERFRRELGAPEPSSEEVQKLIGEIAAERTALETAFARSVLDTRALLEPGQERLYLQFLARLRPDGPAGPPRPGAGPAPLRRPR